MKKVFYFAMALTVALAFASCKTDKTQKNTEETTVESTLEDAVEGVQETFAELSEAAKAKFEELGEGFFGTYKATLPGNPGYESTLTINADLTYTFDQVAINGEALETVEGKITDIDENLVITLVSEKEGKMLFKLVDGKLLMLNPDDATEPGEETREFYFFVRQ